MPFAQRDNARQLRRDADAKLYKETPVSPGRRRNGQPPVQADARHIPVLMAPREWVLNEGRAARRRPCRAQLGSCQASSEGTGAGTLMWCVACPPNRARSNAQENPQPGPHLQDTTHACQAMATKPKNSERRCQNETKQNNSRGIVQNHCRNQGNAQTQNLSVRPRLCLVFGIGAVFVSQTGPSSRSSRTR